MTFLDAAIEVLRNSNDPMHFGEIARAAVDQSLLSHVGRDPEAAMQSCLNSAVRRAQAGGDSVIVRSKPGHYGIRPGADLPPSQPPPAKDAERAPPEAAAVAPAAAEAGEAAEAAAAPEPEAAAEEGTGRRPRRKKKATRRRTTESDAEENRRRRRRGKTPRGEAPAPESVEIVSRRGATKRAVKPVEFEAPSESGLEGVTDVAVVMANAMSRLVEERPELKDEFEAMQQTEDETPVSPPAPARTAKTERDERAAAAEREDRGSRRRRRRRRRGRRVEWEDGGNEAAGAEGKPAVNVLDGVAEVLREGGARSLHVRQIAETLASKGLLGGQISEVERSVTTALLLDIHTHGRTSRFCARGDARYQLAGSRLPEAAAKAEQAVRDAMRALEIETEAQLEHWLQSLGARALESVVRIYLDKEGYGLTAPLQPSRGLGRLVVSDPEGDDADARVLALIVPKRTEIDAKLREGELERNSCTALLLFAMGDVPEEVAGEPDTRVVGTHELGEWMRGTGLGVETVSFDVKVLDPTLIESIGGLDT